MLILVIRIPIDLTFQDPKDREEGRPGLSNSAPSTRGNIVNDNGSEVIRH